MSATALIDSEGCRVLGTSETIGVLLVRGPQPRPLHVPIVPMSTKAPVLASMLYIEMLFDPEFVT